MTDVKFKPQTPVVHNPEQSLAQKILGPPGEGGGVADPQAMQKSISDQRKDKKTAALQNLMNNDLQVQMAALPVSSTPTIWKA